MAEHGVHCTTILPGFVHTQIAHNALTGDGSLRGKEDNDNAGGISPEKCASDIIQAIENNKAEVVSGKGMSKIAPLLQRFIPGLLRKMLANR
jgi:short-subunit dehydrogenase